MEKSFSEKVASLLLSHLIEELRDVRQNQVALADSDFKVTYPNIGFFLGHISMRIHSFLEMLKLPTNACVGASILALAAYDEGMEAFRSVFSEGKGYLLRDIYC